MTRSGKPRRAGARWRVLVHQILPGGRTGDAHHITSDHALTGGGEDTCVEAGGRTYWTRHTELPNTEFDELVIGRAVHIEQMDTGSYWMDLAGVVIWMRIDREGRPKSVSVYGPGDYGSPEPGCDYHIVWSAPQDGDQ